MSRYRIAPEARDDLKEISHYIATEMQSPLGAQRLRARFFQDFRRLARHPHLGQACPEFGEGLRVWLVGNYAVFYAPRPDGVDIVQVVHAARDLPTAVRRIEAPDG